MENLADVRPELRRHEPGDTEFVEESAGIQLPQFPHLGYRDGAQAVARREFVVDLNTRLDRVGESAVKIKNEEGLGGYGGPFGK
jgi:hypothetical protein